MTILHLKGLTFCHLLVLCLLFFIQTTIYKKNVWFRFPTDRVNLCAIQIYFMSLGKK